MNKVLRKERVVSPGKCRIKESVCFIVGQYGEGGAEDKEENLSIR